MARIHFIFADHYGWNSPLALEERLTEFQKEGITPDFIAMESLGIKAGDSGDPLPKPSPRYLKSHESVLEVLNETAAAYRDQDKKLDDKTMHWLHQLGISFLANKHEIPLSFTEAARPKQRRKILRLNSGRTAATEASNPNDDFSTFFNKTKRSFYDEVHAEQARHDEVVRNLRQLIKKYGPESVGIVIFGTAHAGLDKYVENALDVETSAEKAHLIKLEPFHEFYNESQSASYENPKRKIPEDEIARLALAKLLFYKLNMHGTTEEELLTRFVGAVRSLGYRDISKRWSDFQKIKTVEDFFRLTKRNS